jgi:hypothetical protein
MADRMADLQAMIARDGMSTVSATGITRERQFEIAGGGIRVEHSILEVIEHIKSARQETLTFTDHEDGG